MLASTIIMHEVAIMINNIDMYKTEVVVWLTGQK